MQNARKKSAVVTGAGRNIGEAIAKRLAKEGMAIAVVDLDLRNAERVASEIKEAGGDANAFQCDAADHNDIRRTIADTAESFGGIDVLVNNVAVADNKTIFEIDSEDWNKTLAVTLTAPFLFTKFAAEQMVKRDQKGSVVIIGSTSGYFGRARAIAYTAAKGGVANLTKSLAYQLAPHGIRVNAVVPNKIGSPVGSDVYDPNRAVRNLVGRGGRPEDIAEAVWYLSSDAAGFVNGAELFVDGGCSIMLPGNETET